MSSQTCPNCGWLNRASNRFCSNCGASMVPPADGSTTANAGSTPPTAGDTQPVTYVVQRWNNPTPDAEATAPAPPASGFVPPDATPQASTIPIAPPPVPPYSPYGGATTDFSATPPTSSTAQTQANPTTGGTYVPYSADAAQQLQAGTPRRPWLVPAVVIGALALLVLVGVSGFLVLNGKQASPSSSASAQGCSGLAGQTNSSDQNTVLKAIICQSNDEQIQAWHDLNTDILKGTRTGAALSDNIEAVQELQAKKMYALPVNKSIKFGDISATGNTATVKTEEIWSVTFYNKDNGQTVLTQGPDTLQELYHFVKQNDKWLISSVDIVQTNVPNPSPSPGSDSPKA